MRTLLFAAVLALAPSAAAVSIALLAVLALTTWLWGFRLATLCIALAVLAYSAGWYESNNLWDYLLDPLVSTWGLSALLLRWAKTFSPPAPSDFASPPPARVTDAAS